MKVVEIEVMLLRRSGACGIPFWNPVLLEIRTDEGITGVGEVGLAYGTGATASLGMVRDFGMAFVLGRDPFDTEGIWESMFRNSFWAEGGGPVVSAAMSAIDTALWDIKGKALGLPCWKLLGGRINDNLRTYASQLQFGWDAAGCRMLTEPQDYFDAARKASEEGYDCVKVDPVLVAPDGHREPKLRGLYSEPMLRRVRQRVEAVREGAGADTDIILELHSLPSLAGACQLIERLEDLGLWAVEEPVNYATPDIHLALRQRVTCRLAAGERFYTRWGAMPYIQNHTVDLLQPDVGLVGGLTEAKKVCDLAHIADMTIQAHICGTPVATAAGLHLEAAIPNFEIHEHHVYAQQSVNRQLCNEDLQPVAGRFAVPTAPGLGITLNSDALRDAERVVIR